MMWTEMKNNWPELQAKFQTKWNKLTKDELKSINGSREKLLEKLHAHYKTDVTKLGKEVDDFVKNFKPAKV